MQIMVLFGLKYFEFNILSCLYAINYGIGFEFHIVVTGHETFCFAF